MDILLEQSNSGLTQSQKIKIAKAKAKLNNGGSKVPSTDNTTIPSPQTSDDSNKVTQTSNTNLLPSENDDYKIWLQWSGAGREFNQPEFVKAIEKAYLNKDKKQDVY